MSDSKGFTLIEIMVVLTIVGILATFGVSVFGVSIEQTKATVAQNNLYAIAAAQQKYYEDHGSYCAAAPCGDSAPDINTNLHLGVGGNGDPFSYSCTTPAVPPPPYQCTASDATVTLDLNVTTDPTGTTVLGVNVSCPTGGNNCPSLNS